jgi:hypothetical protein
MRSIREPNPRGIGTCFDDLHLERVLDLEQRRLQIKIPGGISPPPDAGVSTIRYLLLGRVKVVFHDLTVSLVVTIEFDITRTNPRLSGLRIC